MSNTEEEKPKLPQPENVRESEPYESYIEDSFVGHWAREDDDIVDQYRRGLGGDVPNEADEEELQHASTIEFDFDSFGPESFIYTPAVSTGANSNITVVAKEDLSITPTNDVSDTNHSSDSTIESKNGQTFVKTEEEPGANLQQQQHQTNQCLNSHQAGVHMTNTPEHIVEPGQIDLKVIEPYKKVISHAGYCHCSDPSISPPNPGEPAPAVIVFSACYLPDRSRRDYDYVMDHLFMYVLTSLHELIADDYILIYLHNTQPSGTIISTSTVTRMLNGQSSQGSEEVQHPNNLPTFNWMKRCYQMIDRKLRKNLKILYLVKPTFWLKTIVIMCKPFISAKFSRKLRFVENMDGLKRCLPVDKLILPASADNI